MVMGDKHWPSPRELADALESGRYKKGANRLARKLYTGDTKYCCLGVCAIEAGYTDDDLIAKGADSVKTVLLAEFPSVRNALGDAPEWLNAARQSSLISDNDHNPTWDRVILTLRSIQERIDNGND